MRSRLATLGAAIASLAGAAALGAQVVRGTVATPDSVPVPGVIVLATTDAGGTAARTLTNARGRFILTLPAPGHYALRVLRIGYRPTQGPTVTVAAGVTETADIVFNAEAVRLASVNVRESGTCRVSADTGLAVARVWEEARKAMLASQLGDGDAPLNAEWIEYDRVLDSSAHRVRAQTVRTTRSATTHAFKSLPPEVLDTGGYVVSDSGATRFYAPDANVLLSDSFMRGHCFHLEAAPRGSGADSLIGVGFQPSRDRRDDREIEGTLWVDRRSAELESLEFRYTNLPEAASRAGAGGRVEFLRLADGRWLVSRWSVRMPIVAAPPRSATVVGGRLYQQQGAGVVRGVQVNGGEVTRVTRNDSVVYVAQGAHVALAVVSRDSTVSAARAVLTLDGTDYRAVGDPSGRITLSPVLAGRYRAWVRTALMDSLGVASIEGEIETREPGDTRADTVFLPRARDLLERSCPRDSVRSGEGMLRGIVRDERARGVPHAAVSVTWQSDVAKLRLSASDRLMWSERTIGTLTGEDGDWRLCGVPSDVPLVVHVASDSGSDARPARIAGGGGFGAVDLVVTRTNTTAKREIATAVSAGAERPRALVEIIVTDANGAVIPEVQLDVSAPGVGTKTLMTGGSGRALLTDVSPGVVTVQARRIGFTPGRIAATVAAGRNTVPIVMSAANVPTLDTVRVVGDQRLFGLRRNDEFEMRRANHQATVSITEADIERRHPVSTWQMLTNIPSIRVVDLDTTVVVVSTRTFVTSIMDQGPCYMAILVNGVPQYDAKGHVDLRNLPAPSEVHGIEVFAGAATIPLQYGGAGNNGKWCGMVAIWTK